MADAATRSVQMDAESVIYETLAAQEAAPSEGGRTHYEKTGAAFDGRKPPRASVGHALRFFSIPPGRLILRTFSPQFLQ